MGTATLDGKEGSIVWVQRKNGTWWPGRVVGPPETSPSSASPSQRRIPVKLLGRDNNSVDWYNLEISKRIKAFRCGEFDDCINSAVESLPAASSLKSSKYIRRKDAIRHALQHEKQEQEKMLKRAGEAGRPMSHVKRRRNAYSTIESNSVLDRADFDSEPLKILATRLGNRSSPNPSMVAENSSFSLSQSSNSEISAGDSHASNIKQYPGTQDLGYHGRPTRVVKGKQDDKPSCLSGTDHANKIACLGQQRWKQNGKIKHQATVTYAKSSVISKFKLHKLRHLSTLAAAYSKCPKRSNLGTTSREHLADEFNDLTESASDGTYLEDLESHCFASLAVGDPSTTKAILIDVELTVEARVRGEHVPRVSLMSRGNGKAIVGHPLEVEVVDVSSQSSYHARGSGSLQLSGNGVQRTRQLAWRTSKRTPVFYMASVYSLPYTFEERKAENAGESSFNVKESRLSKMETHEKALKHAYGEGDTSITQKGGNCISVKHIMTKLLLAVGSQKT